MHYTELLLLAYLNPAIIPDNKVSEFLSIRVPSSQYSVRRMYAIVIAWAKDSFFDSCFVLFQANNWISIFVCIVTDSNIAHSYTVLHIYPDAISSNSAAPDLGSLEAVQIGLNFPEQPFGGMRQSIKHLSQYFDQI